MCGTLVSGWLLVASPLEESPAVAAARAYAEALAPFGFRGAVLAERAGAEELALGIGEVGAGGAAVTPDTLFDLGSNSTCYTAAAALLLVDRGEWTLDDALPALLGDGVEVPPEKRAITLRQLLSHSAGLDHSGHFSGDFEAVARDEAIRRILARPLLYAPGRGSSYSDAGYILTAALPAAEFAGGRVDGIEQGSGRKFGAPTFAILGAGGMVASVRDVATFLRAVRAGELLSDEQATAFESPQHRLGPQQAEGFGFVIATQGARTVRQSAGGTPQLGHNALLSWSQPDDLLLVIHTADAGWRGEDLGPRLRALLEGRAVPPPPALAPRDDVALARTAGKFALQGGGNVELTATRGALELRALDAEGFTALHGSAGGDAAGARNGLDRVFTQRVDAGIEAWRARRAVELGPEKGVTLLGHATVDGGSEPWAFVRVDFERGSSISRFVFGPRGSVEALVLNATLPALRLWPLRDGTFAPFSLGTPPGLTALRIAGDDASAAIGASESAELALEFTAGRKLVARRSR